MRKKIERAMAANRIAMGFEVVDDYLLGRPIAKADVVAAFLAERSDAPAAAPFYRALEAVGIRAADEAFLALRLVLAGHEPTDDAVRLLRAHAAVARACFHDDATALAATLRREGKSLGALAAMPIGTFVERATLGQAATDAYVRDLLVEPDDERNAERDKLR